MLFYKSVVRTALAGAVVLVLGGVPAQAASSDAWITAKAKMALLTTEGVSGTAVNVDTVNGLITLHGKVPSDAERRKAESSVRGIEGVAGVRNLLQVVAEKREGAVAEADDRVKQRVQDVLKADNAFKDVSVESVNSGVVLLAGNVDTLGNHLRAVEHAARVPGVKRVASEIKSPDKLADNEIYNDRSDTTTAKAGDTVSDMWITSAVKMRLMADERTPGLDVNVDTTSGQVTLFGMVPSAGAKAAAEEDAKKVSGVKAVNNSLDVVPPQHQHLAPRQPHCGTDLRSAAGVFRRRCRQRARHPDEIQPAGARHAVGGACNEGHERLLPGRPIQRRFRPRAQFATPEGAFVVRRATGLRQPAPRHHRD